MKCRCQINVEGARIAKGPGSIGTGLIGGHEPSLGRGSGDSRQKQERLFTCRRGSREEAEIGNTTEGCFFVKKGMVLMEKVKPSPTHHHRHHHCPHHWHWHWHWHYWHCGVYLVNTMSRHFLCFTLFQSDKRKLSGFYYSYFIEEKRARQEPER